MHRGPQRTMAAYIAMLRGVNVSGHNTIKMEVLRGLCEGLGFRNVGTYIQSGNIVFQTAPENSATLSKRIGKTIFQSFGFDTPVLVRKGNRFLEAACYFSLGSRPKRLREKTGNTRNEPRPNLRNPS